MRYGLSGFADPRPTHCSGKDFSWGSPERGLALTTGSLAAGLDAASGVAGLCSGLAAAWAFAAGLGCSGGAFRRVAITLSVRSSIASTMKKMKRRSMPKHLLGPTVRTGHLLAAR